MTNRTTVSSPPPKRSSQLTATSEVASGSTHPEDAFNNLLRVIEPMRRRLVAHPIYAAVVTLPQLQTFMATHVYAVWDFMCLAKRLQRDLTSLEPLWRPPRNPALARFINGVIHGEESDLGPDGEAISHYQLYLAAMAEVGAPTESIRHFVYLIGKGVTADSALFMARVPKAAQDFVQVTLKWVLKGESVEVLSAFLFGREDLIPEMFARLLPRWRESRAARQFAYYVERHIQLDGDDHGPAARRALIALAGRDASMWRSALSAAEEAISARLKLWDELYAELTGKAQTAVLPGEESASL